MSKEPKRNIYVGHRYVPKIMGTWNNLLDYEGLSIVTWEGVSYTSKKHVPAGVDIDNNDYWVATGNYNEQVENYRREVKELKKFVNEEMDNMEKHLTDSFEKLEEDLTYQFLEIRNDVLNLGTTTIIRG